MFMILEGITVIAATIIAIISYVNRDTNSVCFWGFIALLNYLTIIITILCKIGISI